MGRTFGGDVLFRHFCGSFARLVLPNGTNMPWPAEDRMITKTATLCRF